MALAIRFEQLIRDGVVSDQSELARLGSLSRARLTQLMNLNNIAPDIQEELLQPGKLCHQQDLSERLLRPLTMTPCWSNQRRIWMNLQLNQASESHS